MKKTIAEFEKLHNQSEADKAKLQNEIDELIRKESELTEAANAAAASGDVDGYMSKSKEKERVSATIFVKRTQLDRLAAFTDADVLAAWADYADAYNKKFASALAAYREKADALRRMYVDLCNLQNAALIERERFGAFIEDAAALNRVKMETVSMESGNLFHGNLSFIETPDMRFCRVGARTAEEDDELCTLFNMAIRQQRPYIK